MGLIGMLFNRLYFLVSLCLLLSLVDFGWAQGPMVTYSFDDGSRYIYENAYPIMSKCNQKGVVYAITNRVVDYYEGYINQDQFLELQRSGWEIGSHTVSHCSTTQLPRTYEDELLTGWEKVAGYDHVYRVMYGYSDLALVYVDGERFWGLKHSIVDVDSASQGYYFDSQEHWLYIHLRNEVNPETVEIRSGSAQRELQQSSSDLRSLGLDCNTFVAPYGNFNESLIEYLYPFYAAYLGAVYGKVYNQYPIVPSVVPIKLIRRGSTRYEESVDDLTAAVNVAIAADGWIILTFHAIYSDGKDTDSYGWPVEKFEQLVKYIHETGVPVVTIQEGLTRWGVTTSQAVPEGCSYVTYESVEYPTIDSNLQGCKPLGVGNVSGGKLNLRVAPVQFASAVDIYMGMEMPVSSASSTLYILDSGKSFQDATAGVIPWKSGVVELVQESLFGNISTSLLPPGDYNFYLAVTPHGETDFDNSQLWHTAIAIQ